MLKELINETLCFFPQIIIISIIFVILYFVIKNGVKNGINNSNLYKDKK
ncbi:hypothetical protein [Clostridium botulinum]|nr:hypothetical protein [Clostridium botulinum]AEB75969.1 putative hypothetical protein [Clostridium botulinum BKT015925]MCD3198417.1 hypothetical protein [Clostridium botulinum C/D]MCD3204016.1 hypothetical protein [Clostridium botulinum C/D]MCD3212180.1 hypothetical protein [Clostridium botulinum C/D]MCD3215049.1 hypothetical protein [Clostridium botulinum C/D]